MKIQQKMRIIGFILFVLWLFAVIHNHERKKSLIENGIETIGVVEEVLINKGHKPDAKIRFRFVDVDNLQVIQACSYCSRSQGYETIIGGFYRVRYVAGKPGKVATIYIDEPVYDTIYDRLLLDIDRSVPFSNKK